MRSPLGAKPGGDPHGGSSFADTLKNALGEVSELQSNALAYIQATEVGGTHPALVEAMGYGNCLVVNDTPENREVAGETALYFKAELPSTLSRVLERIRRHPAEHAALGRRAADRARRRYSWEAMADLYADLFRDLAASRG